MKNRSRSPEIITIKRVIESIFKSDDDRYCMLLKNWNVVMGPLGEKTRLEHIIDQDTLVIGVYDAHWMQELHMLSRTMITAINKQLGKPQIKKIRLKLVAHRAPFISASQKALLRRKASTKTALPAADESTPHERQALEKIEDPQLKSALRLVLKNIKNGHYT